MQNRAEMIKISVNKILSLCKRVEKSGHLLKVKIKQI